MHSPTMPAPDLAAYYTTLAEQNIPVLYEDEEEEDTGEANYHVVADEILHICLKAHLAANRPDYQVFSNMNLYYLPSPLHPRTGSQPYVSPDTMIVKPIQLLDEGIVSYTIGREGPAPTVVCEILSRRSAQQRDLKEKLRVYALLEISEYIIVDSIGKYLPEPLVLKRLQRDGSWLDERDADGGVTSSLDFRLIFDDGGLCVINAETGKPYIRPSEAEEKVAEALVKAAEAEEKLHTAQARIRALEEQLKKRNGGNS